MNYTALKTRIPFSKSVRMSFSRLKQNLKGSRTYAALIVFQIISVVSFILISLFLFVFALLSFLKNEESAPLAVVILFFGLFVGTIALLLYALILSGKNIIVMQAFAKDNNLIFHPWVKVDESQGFAFSVTGNRFARNGVTGKIGSRTFWLYEYRFMSGTDRHPYPNIFTVLMLHLDKEYPQTLLINKNGRLKIIWPRGDMKKVDSPWFENSSLQPYAKDGQLDSGIAALMTQEKIDALLQISPKAEIQLNGRALAVFLPGKPIITSETAEKLFDFTKTL